MVLVRDLVLRGGGFVLLLEEWESCLGHVFWQRSEKVKLHGIYM